MLYRSRTRVRYIISLLLTLTAGHLLAQLSPEKQLKLDSLKQKLRDDSAKIYRYKKFRPFFGIDNRNSFIRQTPVNFQGLQLGLTYKDKHTYGLGVYKITQQSTRPVKTKDNLDRTISESLSLNYITFFYQYTLLDRRFLEIDIPFEIGLGKANVKLVDSATNKLIRNSDVAIMPFGTGLQFVFKPFKWIGVSSMGGYRFVREKSRAPNFNGWYYSFGLWLDVRQIYRDIKFYSSKKKRYRREANKLLFHS